MQLDSIAAASRSRTDLRVSTTHTTETTMTSTSRTRTRTTKTTPLNEVLAACTLAEAGEILRATDAKLGLIPEPGRDYLYAAVDRLIDAAAELDLANLKRVIDNQKHLLATTTGVPMARQSEFLNDKDSEALHTDRNVLLALCLLSVMDYDGDPAPVLTEFKALKRRSRTHVRPNADDETLLLHLWALHLSRGNQKNQRAAAAYAQVDAGLTLIESTRTTVPDVQLAPGDEHILASGYSGDGVAPRILPLEPFHIEILTRYLSNPGAYDHERFTYRPRVNHDTPAKATNAAVASAAGVIDRIRSAVGLKHEDTTPTSVYLARIVTVTAVHGPQAALTASGRTDYANLNEVLWHGTRRQRAPLAKARKNRQLTLTAA
jgi:hypothetical protein